MENGGIFEVQNLEKNDSFLIQGKVNNLGTVTANNVTVIVNDNGNEVSFNFPEIKPGQHKTWAINKEEINYQGEYSLNVEAFSEDEFEIDGTNNKTTHSFYIFGNERHEYNIDAKNKNLLQIETSNSGEYEFSWLESTIIITNAKSQSWDILELEIDTPKGWEFQLISVPILHLSDNTEILLQIKPSLETKVAEYKIKINLTDRNGFEAGQGEMTVNVPQYYGVSIYAEQSDGEVNIGITNSGNGNDYFKLTKELDEGLTLYLTETYFEVEAFETIVVKGAGIETSLKTQNAKFRVQSVGNENITAEVLLEVTSPENQNESSNWIISIFFAISAMIAMVYFIYQRRIQ